ncbi:Hypothetical predicted protein, partial [Paramuricea clavata]
TINITLLVFSGRPDPEWSIKVDDPLYKTIHELFTAAKNSNVIKNPGEVVVPSRLGFKGFFVSEGHPASTGSFIPISHETEELQKRLLESAPENKVSESLKENILEEIENQG